MVSYPGASNSGGLFLPLHLKIQGESGHVPLGVAILRGSLVNGGGLEWHSTVTIHEEDQGRKYTPQCAAHLPIGPTNWRPRGKET